MRSFLVLQVGYPSGFHGRIQVEIVHSFSVLLTWTAGAGYPACHCISSWRLCNVRILHYRSCNVLSRAAFIPLSILCHFSVTRWARHPAGLL